MSPWVSTRFSRFAPSSRRWESYEPDASERLAADARQFKRVLSWVWDHFLWGLGGFIVLTHWWLLPTTLGEPPHHVRELAGAGLLLAPIVFLLGPGHQLRHFIPGGLSFRHSLRLYVSSFVAIWLYCFPVVFYQIVCMCGLRSRIIGWKPTPKPECGFGASLWR